MVCGYLLNGLAVFPATEAAVMPLKVKVIFQQNILQNIEDVGGSLEVSVVLEAPDELVVLEHGDQLHLGPVVLAVAVHAEAALVLVVLEVGHLTLAVPLNVPVEPLAGVVGAEHLDILQHVEVSVLPASLLAVPVCYRYFSDIHTCFRCTYLRSKENVSE